MPTHFSHDCPHCHTRGAGFDARYQWFWPDSSFEAQVLGVCGVCKKGLIVHSRANSSPHTDLVRNDLPYPGSSFKILQTWPIFSSTCPAHVPDNIERFYVQGLENMAAGRFDAAGAMFRKSLDVATKLLAPDHRSETLFKRINKMVESGTLTTAMGDWSHEIRLDGNDAVHDEEPETEVDARASQQFAEAVLTYAFTLPAMVKANRAKRLPAEAGVAEEMEA